MNTKLLAPLSLIAISWVPFSHAQMESGEGAEMTEVADKPAERPTGNQLLNLRGVPKEGRTLLPIGFTWPSSAGDAALCLWKDDKTAVLSFTIDDNCAMNIDWWLKETAAHDIKVTWFLVAGGISGSNPAMNGKWEDWMKPLQAGHALESHTMTHLSASKNPETWKGIEWEYKDSKERIEQNLPGHKVTCLAYPGGGQSKFNDPSVAARFFISGRTTKGMLNGAQNHNYLAINAMTKANFGERPQNTFNNADNLMNPKAGQGYRGWCVVIYHYVKEKDPGVVARIQADLDYAVKNKDQLWIARFNDAARYGQSRETSKLEVKENSPTRIVLNLTDRMDDRYFDFPLTVKVRLPDNWGKVSAQQDGKPAASKIIEHEGAKFALIDVVPDKGDTVLTP